MDLMVKRETKVEMEGVVDLDAMLLEYLDVQENQGSLETKGREETLELKDEKVYKSKMIKLYLLNSVKLKKFIELCSFYLIKYF